MDVLRDRMRDSTAPEAIVDPRDMRHVRISGRLAVDAVLSLGMWWRSSGSPHLMKWGSDITQRRDLELGPGIAVLRLLAQTVVTKTQSSVCSTNDMDNDWVTTNEKERQLEERSTHKERR